MLNVFLEVLPSVRTSADPRYLLILLVIICGLVGLRFYNQYSESVGSFKKKKSPNAKKDTPAESLHFHVEPDRKELKNIFTSYSFTEEQAVFFTRLCKTNKITHPAHLIESRKALDDLFSRTINQLKAAVPSTREIERNKTLLFTIRETIENKRRSAKNITTTRALQSDQSFTLITRSGEQYPMKIIDSTAEGLLCLVPRDSFGNELRLPVWAKMRCFFYSRSGQSYQFNTRIIRYESGKNDTRLLLSHTNSIKAMPNRCHDRKLFETACYFAHVSVANIVNGKHTEHKFYPSIRSFGGVIMDISVGGCSIRSNEPLEQGEYLQIVCNLQDKIEETIIGKVKRLEQSEPQKPSIMHIQFAKMSRATMNRIFLYIYNEGDN